MIRLLSMLIMYADVPYRYNVTYPSAFMHTLYDTLFFNYCILKWGATNSDGNILLRVYKKNSEIDF